MKSTNRDPSGVYQPPALGLFKGEERPLGVFLEGAYFGVARAQDPVNFGRRTVTATDPDYLRRMAEEKAPLMKIRVLRSDRQPVLGGMPPMVSSDASCKPTSRT